jgi:hypothetical protein
VDKVDVVDRVDVVDGVEAVNDVIFDPGNWVIFKDSRQGSITQLPIYPLTQSTKLSLIFVILST